MLDEEKVVGSQRLRVSFDSLFEETLASNERVELWPKKVLFLFLFFFCSVNDRVPASDEKFEGVRW